MYAPKSGHNFGYPLLSVKQLMRLDKGIIITHCPTKKQNIVRPTFKCKMPINVQQVILTFSFFKKSFTHVSFFCFSQEMVDIIIGDNFGSDVYLFNGMSGLPVSSNQSIKLTFSLLSTLTGMQTVGV